MGLDDCALLCRQRAGLQQDRVWNRDLAHVVQRRRMADPLAELGVHTDLFGEQAREATDALDVRARVLVPELDRHRQPANGLLLGDLELGQRPPQLVRAALDRFAERDAAVLAEEPAEQRRGHRQHARRDVRERLPAVEHGAQQRRQREREPGQPAQR